MVGSESGAKKPGDKVLGLLAKSGLMLSTCVLAPLPLHSLVRRLTLSSLRTQDRLAPQDAHHVQGLPVPP